jgi:hypothetical protein
LKESLEPTLLPMVITFKLLAMTVVAALLSIVGITISSTIHTTYVLWSEQDDTIVQLCILCLLNGIMRIIAYRNRYTPKRLQVINSVLRHGKDLGNKAATWTTVATRQTWSMLTKAPTWIMGTITKLSDEGRKFRERHRQAADDERVWKQALDNARMKDQRPRRLASSRIAKLGLLALLMLADHTAEAVGDGQTQMALQNILVSCKATKGLSDTAYHRYDSDSFILAIDNCSSRCITNSMVDFIAPPTAVSITVKGIGGDCMATYVGTVQWMIEDEHGVVHEWLIPNTYYNKQSPYRLLSPQHWAQEQREGRGAMCTMYFDAVEVFWNDCRDVRSIPLDGHTNIALIRSQPAYSQFHSFCNGIATADDALDEAELLELTPVVTDNESSVDEADGDDKDTIAERQHPDLLTTCLRASRLAR